MDKTKNLIQTLKSSVTRGKDYITVTLLDLSLYCLFFISFKIWSIYVSGKTQTIKSFDPTTNLTPELTKDLIGLKGALDQIIVASIIFVVITLLIYTLIKSITWQFIVGQNKKLHNYKKYLLINTLCTITTAALIFLNYFLVNEKASAIILIVILVWSFILSLFTNSIFLKTKKAFASFGKALGSTITKTPSFALPILCWVIISSIVMIILSLIGKIFPWISVTIAILFLVWTRFYAFEAVNNSKFYKSIK